MTNTDTDSKLVGSRLLVWNVICLFASLPTPLWNIQSPTSTIKQPVLARSCHVLSFVSKDLSFLCFFFWRLSPFICLRVWMTAPSPPPLYEGLDPQVGCIEKGTFYLQGNFDYCIRLCQINRNGKNISRSGLISSSSIHSLISLTWSRQISGYGKHNIS